MNVLFISSEAFPFSKSGGLGDVCGSLPAAIKKFGADVRVIIPKFACIQEELLRGNKFLTTITMSLSWRKIQFSLEETQYEGIHYYFIDNPYYFGKERIYGYSDDAECFSFFSKAVLEALPFLGYRPDILHCHDWHTALVPLFLKENYREVMYYQGIKTILTVHNLGYQGIAPVSYFEDVLGFAGSTDAWEQLEYHGSLNFLKAGLLAADLLSTVSPTYAEEIKNPFYGENLDEILRHRQADLNGILNGIDTEKYDPRNDPNLFINSSSSIFWKTENKLDLQNILGLSHNSEVLLVSMVSRLVNQKGIDLLACVLEEMVSLNLQMVILGTGEKRYEDMFSYYAFRYPEKLKAILTFDNTLASKIYGASDLLLMPSLFEPCGLSQMIAMRYGTLPVVRETGGLRDSVLPFNEFTGEGNGFSFANYNAHELLFTVQKATKLFYEEKNVWKKLVDNAFRSDFSWDNSAEKYVLLYESCLIN
ncbi:glycogen synthase GlgA [Dehalobacter sp. DCM]|uniref:glycogen synthase GlgA n=1 Tax=Dehalobacter sp. DCM TaxID=2907827 RepID=UPI003081DE54|nr:glycogen synthase GlgA [Dehalobacter sp. DCM]